MFGNFNLNYSRKKLHYRVGTNDLFDKAWVMSLFHIKKKMLFNHHGGSQKNNRSLFANYDSETYV